MYRLQGGTPSDNGKTLDELIAEAEGLLAPEPSPAEIEEREKLEKLAGLRRKVRAQQIQKALDACRDAAKGMYLVDAVDFDERGELAAEIMSWFIVRGSSREETKAFQEAQDEAKVDVDSSRAKLVTLAKKCIVHQKLDTPDRVLAFEDAVNKRFGMALNSLVEKILRLGGHRAAQERAFR